MIHYHLFGFYTPRVVEMVIELVNKLCSNFLNNPKNVHKNYFPLLIFLFKKVAFSLRTVSTLTGFLAGNMISSLAVNDSTNMLAALQDSKADCLVLPKRCLRGQGFAAADDYGQRRKVFYQINVLCVCTCTCTWTTLAVNKTVTVI